MDDTHMAEASYGPAGLIFAGTEFEREDRRLLLESFAALWRSLARMQREPRVGKHANGEVITGSAAYSALIEPYLSDPADSSMVGNMREKVRQLDRENELRAKKKPPEPPRVALVASRRQLERHDAAVRWLAKDLEDVKLHAVFPRLMSEREEGEMQDRNAEIFARFQRLRASGVKRIAAIDQTARDWDISSGAVERIIEFRSEDKPDECSWEGCGRAPFSQNLCQAHYMQKRRAGQKKRSP